MLCLNANLKLCINEVSYNGTYCTLEVLILPLDGLQMIQGLLIGVLQFKELCAQATRLPLRTFQLRLALLILLFPLSQHLGEAMRWIFSF